MNIRLIGYGRLAKSLVPHWPKAHCERSEIA